MKKRCYIASLPCLLVLGLLAAIPAFSAESGTGEIRGKVTIGGKPTAGFHVSVWSQTLQEPKNVQTAEDGTYSIRGVPAGQVQVNASMPSLLNRQKNKRVDVDAKEPATADFNFTEIVDAGTVEGTITVDGAAPQYGNVDFNTSEGLESEHWFAQVQEGKFRLENIPAGTITMNIGCNDNNGRWRNRRVKIDVLKDQVLQKNIEFFNPSKLAGTVKGLPEGAQAVATVVDGEFKVEKLDLPTLQQVYKQTVGQTALKADGSFTFDRIEAGPYTVVVWISPPDGAPPSRFVAQTTKVSGGKDASVELSFP